MPTVYLSPSLQEFNPYVGGGNEEYYMNLIADAMEPYLRASGISFVRNNPEMTLRQAINDSNAGNYDLHLAIHSNASPPANAGANTGADIYYFPSSASGERFANIISDNYRNVYPRNIQVIPTTSLAEVRRTKAPSALIEVGYHDNTTDANWIRNNVDNIARSLSKSIADYFGVPFAEPQS
ncbi:N-acetylmuramoyl-L-alanine amidase [bacterium]|nr:N-acetylmuramoyl-L-alanine amidase [bacterium]